MKKIVIDGPDQVLYQWDKGQRLRLHGYSTGTRVDFARCNQNKSVSKYAYTEDGAVFCDIPDALLMEPNHLHGYVYVTNGSRGETAREFMLPVIRRPKPEDYVEPEEELLWHDLEDRLTGVEKQIEELKNRPGSGSISVVPEGDALIITTSMDVTTDGDAIIIGGA